MFFRTLRVTSALLILLACTTPPCAQGDAITDFFLNEIFPDIRDNLADTFRETVRGAVQEQLNGGQTAAGGGGRNEEVGGHAENLAGNVVNEGENEHSDVRQSIGDAITEVREQIASQLQIPTMPQQQILEKPEALEFNNTSGCLNPPKFDPWFLGSDMKTWSETCKTLGVNHANVKNSDIGQRVAEEFGPGGNRREGGQFKEHPWTNGNPEWLQSWIAEDTEGLMEDFMGCLEPKVVGICVDPKIVLTLTIALNVEYYWPEAVGETNNFCIGSFLAGQFREPFIRTKDALTKPLLTQIKTTEGDTYEPEMSDPHRGQSHVDDYGFHSGLRTRNYETHVYRPFLDTILATIAPRNTTGVVYENPLCLLDCLPPGPFKEDQDGRNPRFAINWSEFLLAPFWRVPELSWARVLLAAGEQEGQVLKPLYGTLPGLAYHGTTLSPMLPHPDTRPGQNVLPAFTCASYRAAKQSNPIAFAMRGQIWPLPLPEMDKLCYHQSLGQLYPLVGAIEVNGEATAPIAAVRRFFEWSSWGMWDVFEEGLGFRIKTNSFEDRQGETEYGERPGDKLQRIFPKPSACYRVDDVDERNRELWPTGLVGEDKEFTGNRKEVHWNRRRCCISVYSYYGVGAGCFTKEE